MSFILRHLKPFGCSVLLIIILTFGQVVADLMLPMFMAKIVDVGIAKNNTHYILSTGVVMLLIAFAGVICAFIAGFLAAKAAVGMGRNLRSSIFAHVTNYSLAEFDRLGTASLITRTTNDVQQIQSTTFLLLRMMLRAPLICLGSVFMAINTDRELAWILLPILPILFAFLFFISKMSMPLMRRLQKQLDGLNLVIRENLVGMRIVRAFNRVDYEKQRFAKSNSILANTTIKANRLIALFDPGMLLAMNLLIIAIIWISSSRVLQGNLMIGNMIAFMQYTYQIFMTLFIFAMMYILLPRAFTAAERVEEVFSIKADISDTDQVAADHNTCMVGCICFDDVVFRYSHAEKPAINHVSFSAKPGETVAIIGGTGSGKTTLVNLLERYYDVESGAIYLDGVDIRMISQQTLRTKIGLVPQKAILFSGDIASNIRVGNQNATDEQVRIACEVAQAAEFIDQMPEGYASHVTQGGNNLSGGQKQRLCIARAIVKKPEILVFDDSFSALDYRTDFALQKALREEITRSTMIIIAQRVSSIKYADRILVMDQGELVGTGTHEELLNSNQVYRQIVESQLNNDENL